jgi:hypothetical protein
MIPIFESTLPIFLLVILGVVLKRAPQVDRSVWHGLEEVGYYVLFPALLFLTLYRADFGGLTLTEVATGCLATVMIMFVLLFVSWPLFRARGVSLPEFTTIVQTTTRWNGFVALAIADKLFGETGLALTALVMAIIIIPINFGNVALLVWYLSPSRNIGSFVRRIVTNPLILACVAGLAFRYAGIDIYQPIEQAVDLVARASLGMGMILVGAGLRIRDTVKPKFTVVLSTFVKLLFYPLILTTTCWLFGLRGEALIIVALCGAVPTAMNGYLLARQMGGDAPLYATVATLQTAASFLTIPLVIYLATYVASG